MFSRGLSLDQAPPFGVVLRFFLTLPPMSTLLGLTLLLADERTLLLWDAPAAVGMVHLALLGFAATAMVGALFQMLPVIAGASVKDPLYHARWIHAFMVLGALMLSLAFLLQKPALLHPAMALLAGSLGFVVFLMLAKLAKVENKTPSVVGMMTALVSLGLGLVFAVWVALAFIGVDSGVAVATLRNIHLHFMLFGWIATLVMGVAFQVIEMFYVTPPYPAWFRRYLPLGLLGVLTLQALSTLAMPVLAPWFDGLAAAALALFAAVTLRRLSQRKRPVADATVWLWRTAMGALLASTLLWAASLAGGEALFNLSALAFGYFVMSVIVAMSYKIIPFLVWFHLNAKGVLETPMMGDILPAKRAKAHLWVHWSLGAALAAAPFLAVAFKAAGAALLVASLLFGYNLFQAARIYGRLKDKGLMP